MIAVTQWSPEVRAIITRLSGMVTVTDVGDWIAGLDRALAQIPPGTEVVLLSNLHGYEPADLDAHRRLRAIIPLRLAAMGFRTALVDAVGGEIVVAERPAVVCTKVAHVHHDAEKMAAYETAHGTQRERFFSSAAFANEWLLFD
jgi:hypothetical protein